MPGQKNPLLDRQGAPGDVARHRSRHDPEARDARQVAQHRHARRAAGAWLRAGQSTSRSPTIPTRRRSSSPRPAIRTASRPSSTARTTATSRTSRPASPSPPCGAQVGIQADLKTESRTTYFPRQDRGETDISMLGWATLPPMDGFSVLSILLASRRTVLAATTPNDLSNPKIDELTRKAGVELDESKRRAMLAEALKIAHDEVAFIPLHQQPVAWAVADDVDVPQFADEYVRLWFATSSEPAAGHGGPPRSRRAAGERSCSKCSSRGSAKPPSSCSPSRRSPS